MAIPSRPPRVQVSAPVSANGLLAVEAMSALLTPLSPRDVAAATVPTDHAKALLHRWTELAAWSWIWQHEEAICFRDPIGQRLRVLLWQEGVQRARATGEVWTPWLDALDAIGALDRLQPHELQGLPSIASQDDRVTAWAATAAPATVQSLIRTCRGPRFAATLLRAAPQADVLSLLETAVLPLERHEALLITAVAGTPDDTAQPAARTAYCVWALDRRALALTQAIGRDPAETRYRRGLAERACAVLEAAMEAPGGVSPVVLDRILADLDLVGVRAQDHENLLFGALRQPAFSLTHLRRMQTRIHSPVSLVAAIMTHPLATDVDIWTPCLNRLGATDRVALAGAVVVRREPAASTACLHRVLGLGNPAGHPDVAACYVHAVTHPAANEVLWTNLACWPDGRVREALASHASARATPAVWRALLESRSATILTALLTDATGAVYCRLVRRLITVDPDAALTVLERHIPVDAGLQADDLGRLFATAAGATPSPAQQARFFRILALLATTPLLEGASPPSRPRARR